MICLIATPFTILNYPIRYPLVRPLVAWPYHNRMSKDQRDSEKQITAEFSYLRKVGLLQNYPVKSVSSQPANGSVFPKSKPAAPSIWAQGLRLTADGLAVATTTSL